MIDVDRHCHAVIIFVRKGVGEQRNNNGQVVYIFHVKHIIQTGVTDARAKVKWSRTERFANELRWNCKSTPRTRICAVGRNKMMFQRCSTPIRCYWPVEMKDLAILYHRLHAFYIKFLTRLKSMEAYTENTHILCRFYLKPSVKMGSSDFPEERFCYTAEIMSLRLNPRIFKTETKCDFKFRTLCGEKLQAVGVLKWVLLPQYRNVLPYYFIIIIKLL